jgi:2-amino-4-hydroxy-6-hydroxymethyldihydropteridine diphosphokinase
VLRLRGLEMNNSVFLSIGSNIRDREKNLQSAIKLLEKVPEIAIRKLSSIYETDPVGFEDQARFLNAVIRISTSFSPQELLDFIQKIEKKLGRKREIHWGPRTIDLDILLYNQENINSEQLTIPHPRMFERGFVMIPLLEIDPNVIDTYNISNFASKDEGVKLWKQSIGEDEFEHFES